MPRLRASMRRDLGAGVLDDHVAHVVVQHHDFVQALPAAVAGVVAVVAAFAVVEAFAGDVLGAKLQLHQLFFGRGVFGFAVEADFADQALGDDAFDGGGHQERFEAQVQQTGDGAGGVVGVQGAEDQVAGERGLHGDFGGFLVADFADQDDVGVLAQHAAQDAGEGQFDFGFDLALDDAVDVVFDGVFGGDEFAAGVVEFAQGGIERGGFSGAGGAGDDARCRWACE